MLSFSHFRRAALTVLLISNMICSPKSASADELLDIPYGSASLQKLDVYLPKERSGSHVAILLIHGGGWSSGDKRSFQGVGRIAAKRGFVAVAANYRLATGSAKHRWPAQLDDAEAAVGWIRQHASELDVKPDRICALGDSAGGHLAVFLAAVGQLAGAQIACAIDELGPIDLTTSGFRPPTPRLFGPLTGPELGAAEVAASPIFHIGPGTAPILIVHGTDDRLVPVEQAHRLYNKLKADAVTTQLVTYSGGHSKRNMTRREWLHLLDTEFTFILEQTAHPAG